MYSDNISTGRGGRGRGRGGSHYGGGGGRSSAGFDESRLGPLNDGGDNSNNNTSNYGRDNYNSNNNNSNYSRGNYSNNNSNYGRGNYNSNNNRNNNQHQNNYNSNWNNENNDNSRGPRNNRNSNFNSSNRGGPTQNFTPNPAVVEIHNFIGKDENALSDFLKKKCSTRVEILAIRSSENGRLQMLTGTFAMARALTQLTGTNFAGRNLSIQVLPKHVAEKWTQEYDSGQPNVSIDAWIKVMTPRYNPSIRLLDLSKIESEPLVLQHNLLGGRPFNKQTCSVLIGIISRQFSDVVSICFDNNYIEKLSDFSAMNQFLPNVQNLSFKNNRLMTMKDLEGLCSLGELPQLTELLLFDNPVRDACIKRDGDDSTFRTNVSAMYPQLKQLDGGPVTPSIHFDLSMGGSTNAKAGYTPQIFPSFYDSDVAMGTAANFLSKYFVCFDSNRSALGNVYDPSAFFSLDMSTHLNRPARFANSKTNWRDYQSLNRNHTQAEISTNPSERLAFGSQMIIDVLNKLPKTTHRLDDPTKVCVDSWMLPDLYPLGGGPGASKGQYLYIVVHGEFSDSSSGSLSRSFDRTFILQPAPEGSPAAMDGWQVVIMSDSWTLRAYSNPKNFTPTPAPSTPTPTPPTQSANSPVPSNTANLTQVSPEQQSMLTMLHQKTGLNYQYSLNCLSGNNWDLERAYQNFLQLQASNAIPPEAFNK